MAGETDSPGLRHCDAERELEVLRLQVEDLERCQAEAGRPCDGVR
ncbi:hypothetical protein P8A22_03380 [Streptomyces laculatispora]|uniref:Uncharacterized protein n=1 Tax=Streptomyces laculatispora TaxID=887464 RepID=A0ABY9HX42_9ACTN|nr:hypothetical protein [Streptomyces laculatispora]WLQ39153.1 hypothetical protein P8A22_03380 [Streptomyces laculatispora]